MKRQKFTPGWIVEVPVKGEYYCYAQMIYGGNLSFFDYRSFGKRLEDLSVLNDARILFTVCVYSDIISLCKWPKVGKLPFREGTFPMKKKYIYHPMDRLQYELYNVETGEISPATKEECIGLEQCAVWDDWHIEERLDDYFNRRRNRWLTEELTKDF